MSDAKLRIRSIVAGWPGSMHDSFMLLNSGITNRFEAGEFADYLLLGDSGYGCKQWLRTPLLHPQGLAQSKFNRAHKRTRCIVERCIGVLKSRFR